MTETEWLASTDPQPMLEYLRGKVSDRKLRLFACACARQSRHLLDDQRSRTAVEVTEKYADGLATKEELVAARNAARNATENTAWDTAWDTAWYTAWYTAWSASWAAARDAARAAARAAARDAARDAARAAARDAARAKQANLLRDIFGNPFRQVQLVVCHCGACVQPRRQHHNGPCARRRMLTPTVRQLTQAAYDHRQPDGSLDPVSLAAVADSLEEAGCDRQEVLVHLRSPGPYYRGMWSLDMVLGKE